ncbi:MAG TPA: MASE4 domain-containing protein [Stellaceae bacterium]|nr:MASE4 domain-containing protein [Stellaceae bacterium]
MKQAYLAEPILMASPMPESLASVPAETAQYRIAAIILLLFALATAALLPMAADRLPPIPGFVAMYQTALIVAYAVSAFLLFAQFHRSRSVPVLIVGGGCLYTAAIVTVQLLTFPNIFTTDRLLGNGPDTTIWLWTFWHLGPPISALIYAAVVRGNRHPLVATARVPLLSLATAAGIVLLIAACAVLCVGFVQYLPKCVVGDDYTLLTTSGIGPGVELLTIAALVMLWRVTRQGRTVLEVWLAVSLVLLILDNLLTLTGAARGTIGWYGGRIEALLSGCVILGVYLREIDVLQTRADVSATRHAVAEADLRTARDSLDLALEAAGMGLWDLDLATGAARRSARHDRIFGYTAPCPSWDREALLEHVLPEDRESVEQAFEAAVPSGRLSFERRIRRADGSVRWISMTARVDHDEQGAASRIAGVVMDVTDRRTMEDQLRQSQKMEAVGKLTGGVAHDFNNLLTVITGALELMLRHPEDSQRVARLSDNALKASRRGERLIKQLMAFSRQQVLRPETVNPNKLLLNFDPLVRGAIGEAVKLTLELDPSLDPVQIDPVQFEAVILNLVVNARDAMVGRGGGIVIESRNVLLDEAYTADSPEVVPGPYSLIAVSDTGHGMDTATMARAFDPFFTTKEVGKGSGLGLSQAYGFVKSAGGHIKIYSEVDVGTTVKLYLPKSANSPRIEQTRAAVPLRRAAYGETVLVVEDDLDVLSIAVLSLNELGYTVISATNARDALEQLGANIRIDILFSDVVMPGGMNGAQLAVEARRVRPDLKVLLTSGYTAAALANHHGLLDDVAVLGKPYGRDDLETKLRLVLSSG